jgi:hypothetical protein
MLGSANFVQQFVECLRRNSLARGERAKHIDQEEPHAKNLRE